MSYRLREQGLIPFSKSCAIRCLVLDTQHEIDRPLDFIERGRDFTHRGHSSRL